MYINKLFISTSRKYKPPHIRSYTLNVSHDSLDSIYGLVRDGSSRNLTPLNLSRHIPGVIGLSKLGIESNIPYGWGETRLRFMMEVESEHSLGTLYSYIQGYSDYYDSSLSGSLDPKIVLFINSVTEILYFVDPNTNRPDFRILKSYNVFNNGYSSYDSYNARVLKVIRPLDVISNLDMLNIPDADDYVIDTTSNLSDVKTSKRMNNDPMRYLSKVLDSYVQSRSLSSIGYSSRDLTSNAMSLAAEDTLLSNPFLSYIHDITGEYEPTSFSIEFLDSIDRHLLTDPNRTVMLKISDIGHRVTPSVSGLDSDDTECLSQPTIETVLAQEIIYSISDTMSTNFITELNLSMTNNTVNLTPAVIIHQVSCFIDKAYSLEEEFCNRLIVYIENILMPKITQNSNLLVECSLLISLNTDASIEISVNGQPYVVYRFPIFADSRYSPVITDKVNQDNVVGEFDNLISSIGVVDGSTEQELFNYN